MYAIASLLDPISDKIVRDLWNRFEFNCGLTGIKITPLPHFSWMGAEEYQLGLVEGILEEEARRLNPFTVRAVGLGMFTGVRPVVYISLVKNEIMLRTNTLLWERLRPYTFGPNGYYHPTRWMPHITLAFHEADPDRLGCAVEDIAFQRIEFEIVVDHFAIIYQTEGNAGLHSQTAFGVTNSLERGNSEYPDFSSGIP
jgi:2'-5' RNA ligase